MLFIIRYKILSPGTTCRGFFNGLHCLNGDLGRLKGLEGFQTPVFLNQVKDILVTIFYERV